jgi:type IV secretory pathway TrbF-like protein
MTKKDALKEFRSCGRVVRGDAIWTRENWNDYTDFLCRDGQITMKQYETWTNPF